MIDGFYGKLSKTIVTDDEDVSPIAAIKKGGEPQVIMIQDGLDKQDLFGNGGLSARASTVAASKYASVMRNGDNSDLNEGEKRVKNM